MCLCDVCVLLSVFVCAASARQPLRPEVKFPALWFELLCAQGFCVESCLCVKLCVSKRMLCKSGL